MTHVTVRSALLLCWALPAAVAAQPKHLRLEAPVARADEGIPLGNGRVGALVWGEGSVVRVSLDRGDLWDLRDAAPAKDPDRTWSGLQRLVAARDQKRIAELFLATPETAAHPTKLQPARIEIELPAATCRLRAVRLDLGRAEAVADLGGATVRVHVPLGGLVARIEVEGAVPVRIEVQEATLAKALGYTLSALAQASAKPDGDGRSWGNGKAYRHPSGAGFAVCVAGRQVEGGTRLAAAVATRDDGADPAVAATRLVEAAVQKGYEEAVAPSVARWQQYRAASSVVLPNAVLQAQYDLARYLCFAGSQEGGTPMSPQGLWTCDDGKPPPWKGAYRNDLATEAAYLPCHAVGVEALGAPLVDWLSQLGPRFTRHAKERFGVDGLLAPGACALDGTPLGGSELAELSPLHTAWLAHGLWLRWRHTLNRGFLERTAYPWTREAGKALQALLVPGASGKLRLPLSVSPGVGSTGLDAFVPPDSSYEHALLRWHFGALATLAHELGERQEEARWRQVLERLEPLEVDAKSKALLVARGVPYAESQPRLSHLIAIFPLGLVDVGTSPEEQSTVLASLGEVERRGTKGWVGSTFGWYAALCARAGLGDHALGALLTYQQAFTSRNGLHVNGDQSGTGISRVTGRVVSLDGNLLAMQAVHEMLLQSHGGVVRVFPAVPGRWTDVAFTDLHAEGAFRVSAERKAGKTVLVRVLAEKGGLLRLLDPFPGREVEWELPPGVKPVRRPGAGYEVELAAGAGVIVRGV